MMRFVLMNAVVAVVSATHVYVTDTPNESPGFTSLWSIDVSAGTSTRVAHDKKDRTQVSGAVVCGGVYYAVNVDFNAGYFGLTSVDLSSNTSAIVDIPASASGSLFHNLACDPQSPNNLLVIASDSASVDVKRRKISVAEGATFSLKRFDVKTHTATTVGTFPANQSKWAGQDGMFAFTANASAVWAAWPADTCPDCGGSKKGGRLHVMDTTTGVVMKSVPIKEHGALHGKANPYFVVPETMRGVFDYGSDDKLYWVDLELTDDALTYKKDKSANDMWSSSMPQQWCHGNLLVAPHNTNGLGASGVYVVNTKDGSHVENFDFSQIKTPSNPQTSFGALACA